MHAFAKLASAAALLAIHLQGCGDATPETTAAPTYAPGQCNPIAVRECVANKAHPCTAGGCTATTIFTAAQCTTVNERLDCYKDCCAADLKDIEGDFARAGTVRDALNDVGLTSIYFAAAKTCAGIKDIVNPCLPATAPGTCSPLNVRWCEAAKPNPCAGIFGQCGTDSMSQMQCNAVQPHLDCYKDCCDTDYKEIDATAPPSYGTVASVFAEGTPTTYTKQCAGTTNPCAAYKAQSVVP